jgi:hypothetical protein
MKQKNTAPVAEEIVELQRQLDEFRSTQRRRTKLPESLWRAAVELARQHGLSRVAQPLRLDYTALKERLGRTSGVQQPMPKQSKPTFVELISPAPVLLEECVIEVESAAGSKMRIQWKSNTPPDWNSLLRAWRDSEKR